MHLGEGISLTNACRATQSVFYQVFNALSYEVLKRTCFMEKYNISFKKHTERVVLLQVKEKVDTNYRQVQGWKILRTFPSCTKHFFEGHDDTRTQLCSFENEKLISRTWFGSWFLKIVSRATCFFTLVHAFTKNLKKAYNNTVY